MMESKAASIGLLDTHSLIESVDILAPCLFHFSVLFDALSDGESKPTPYSDCFRGEGLQLPLPHTPHPCPHHSGQGGKSGLWCDAQGLVSGRWRWSPLMLHRKDLLPVI